jgi:thymidylate kinase
MDAKIIEIIGPPGIGKTTIYEALCTTWSPVSNWIYLDALLTPKPRFSEFKAWFEYQLKKVLRKKIVKSIPVEYGLRFVEEYQDLANFYWNHLSNPDIYHDGEIKKRFRSAYFLYADFCKYQAILESRSSKPCIINEGLLQKSFLIQDDKQLMRDVINKYVPLLPLPHAIIYINTPNIGLVLERLRSRKKIIASHFGKGDKELKDDIENWQLLLNTISEIMQRKGVPVYNIDGDRSIEENVVAINNLLNNTKVTNSISIVQQAEKVDE